MKHYLPTKKRWYGGVRWNPTNYGGTTRVLVTDREDVPKDFQEIKKDDWPEFERVAPRV